MLREKVLRVLGYSTKCLWADLAVLFGLGCAGVGIGYGNMPVATGGISISLSAAWFSIRENQQALLSQQSQRAPTLNEEKVVSSDQSYQDSVQEIINVCRDFHNYFQIFLNPRFTERQVQEVLELLLNKNLPNSSIRREFVVPKPQPKQYYAIDFIIPDKYCAIEVKILNSKSPFQIFEELKEDIIGYQKSIEDISRLTQFNEWQKKSSDLRKFTLICFVYDPYNKIHQPDAWASALGGSYERFKVVTLVVQNPNSSQVSNANTSQI